MVPNGLFRFESPKFYAESKFDLPRRWVDTNKEYIINKEFLFFITKIFKILIKKLILLEIILKMHFKSI